MDVIIFRMLGYSYKSYLCHTCNRTSLIDTSNLICPICQNDFLEDTTTARMHQQQEYAYTNYYCHTCQRNSLLDPRNPVCSHCGGRIVEDANRARQRPEVIFQENSFPHQYPNRQSRPQEPRYQEFRQPISVQRSFWGGFSGFPGLLLMNSSRFGDFGFDPFTEFDSFFNGNHFERRQERVLGRLFGDMGLDPDDYFSNNQLFGFDDIIQLLIQRNHAQTHPATDEAINRLRTTKADVAKSDQKCSVCMDDIKEGSDINELTCKHVFHPDCIIPWLRVKNTCPVCRQEVR